MKTRSRTRAEATTKTADSGKLDLITDQLRDLKVQFADKAPDKKKPSETRAHAWCSKCYKSGHVNQDCPKQSARVHQVELDEDELRDEENIEYFWDMPSDAVYQISMVPGPCNLKGRTAYPSGPRGMQIISNPTIPPAACVFRSPLCYNCDKPRHFYRDCPSPKRQGDERAAPVCMVCKTKLHSTPNCLHVLQARANAARPAPSAAAPSEAVVQMVTMDWEDDLPNWSTLGDVSEVSKLIGDDECYRVSYEILVVRMT